MNKILSRFEAPDATAATGFVTAAIGMVVAFRWLPKEQAEAGGAFVMAALVLLRAKKPTPPAE